MNMKDMLSKLNTIDSKQTLTEELSVNRHDISQEEYVASIEDVKTTVEENISLNADGTDAMHLILKLAGLPTNDSPGSHDEVSTSTEMIPVTAVSPTDSEMDMMDAELDEYANTPMGGSEPTTLGLDAALPSGNDLSRAKGMHKHGYHQGDNPLAMEEVEKIEGKLRKMFEDMSEKKKVDELDLSNEPADFGNVIDKRNNPDKAKLGDRWLSFDPLKPGKPLTKDEVFKMNLPKGNSSDYSDTTDLTTGPKITHGTNPNLMPDDPIDNDQFLPKGKINTVPRVPPGTTHGTDPKLMPDEPMESIITLAKKLSKF